MQNVQKDRKYQSVVRDKNSELLTLDGRRSLVDAKLKNLVPDNRKTAEDYFILGNMLYRADIKASDEYIKLAEAKLPNEPSILLERGMREHRTGNCKTALGYYDKFHSSDMGRNHAISWAYATHCRLVLSDFDGAIKNWGKSNFRDRHIAIEEAMYEIFSKSNPDSDRERKIIEASKGAVDALCGLVYLDMNWELNWWNVIVNKPYLAHDIEYGRRLLKNDAAGSTQFALCYEASTLSLSDFKNRLSEAGYWGAKQELPQSSTLTYIIIKKLTGDGIAKPADVLQSYEDQLLTRLKMHPDDKPTLDVLAYLYSASANKEKLATIDFQGWKNLHQRAYAESYLINLIEKSKSKVDFQDQLSVAASEFPNSTLLTGLQMQWTDDPELKAKYRMSFTAAQFANVADPVANEGYRLSNWMASLMHKLDSANVGDSEH